MRRMLCAVGALAAVLIYLIWWVTYAGIHYTPRYAVRPPGVAGEVQSTSVRLLSLTRAEQLVDTSEDKSGKSEFPDPGGVWIVAEFEGMRHDQGKTFVEPVSREPGNRSDADVNLVFPPPAATWPRLPAAAVNSPVLPPRSAITR